MGVVLSLAGCDRCAVTAFAALKFNRGDLVVDFGDAPRRSSSCCADDPPV
jgi:hypothetical protein